ncbi:MAG: DUF4184 family protein [Pseudolysinimonas sp.]
MPFTPSHIAAALPLLRTPLPVAPLVIGTMAPDVPYFLPLRIPRDLTHSLLGVPTVDLALTVVLVLLWYAVLRPPVVDLLPAVVRERMAPRGAAGWRPAGQRWLPAICLAVLAALVGILTHLAWDAFTHENSPLVRAVPLLHTELGPLQVSSWLQHASTIGGLVALALWARSWMRRTPRVPVPSPTAPGTRAAAWAAVTAAFGLAGFAVLLAGMSVGIAPLDPSRLFVGVTVAGGAAGFLGVLICVMWWLHRAVLHRALLHRALLHRALLHRAEHRDDLAEHLGVVAQDRLER